jgi:hypothetical protein
LGSESLLGQRLSRSTEFRLNSEAKIYLFINCLQQQNMGGLTRLTPRAEELTPSLRHSGETLDPQTLLAGHNERAIPLPTRLSSKFHARAVKPRLFDFPGASMGMVAVQSLSRSREFRSRFSPAAIDFCPRSGIFSISFTHLTWLEWAGYAPGA